MMSQLNVALQTVKPNLAFLGYPYGNRIMSLPRKPTEQADVAIKPNQAYITMIPARDERGMPIENQFETMLDAWPDPHCRDHYDNEFDGKKMAGAETFPWRRFFAPTVTSEDDMAPGQRPDPPAAEMWAKFGGGGDVSLFDIPEAPTTAGSRSGRGR
jgi:hypothetical protein